MGSPEVEEEPQYTSVTKSPDGTKPADAEAKVEGFAITFEEVTYSLVKRSLRGRRCITLLQDVTGYILPGQMLALMGPSGCGKTTLLDVLAGRKTQGTIQGCVLFGGKVGTKRFLRRNAGYVEQQDTLLGMLSVQEMLLYTAELKLPRGVPHWEKRQRVDQLLETLGLNACKNTTIGSQMARGISGGQARRVSIGISLITRPQVLFLDEPTSGLDAATSDAIITCVRDLALADGVSVVSTIHTPTSFCFTQFDRLMLMAQGRLLYFGDNLEPMLKYFASLGYSPRAGDSVAESAIDIVSRIQSEGRVAEMALEFDNSDVARANEAVLGSLRSPGVPGADVAEGDSGGATGILRKGMEKERATITPSWWAMFVFLRYRTLHNYMSFAFVGPRVLDKLLFSSLMAILYHGQGAQAGVMQIINISALNFMWVVIPAFAAGAYTPTISLDRALFYRERNDGLYRTSTYVLCKMIEEMLVVLVYSIAVSAMVFYAVQLRGSFVLFWLVYVSANAISVAFAYFVAAASPNLDVANAAVPAFMMIMLFFAGFLILTNAIPAAIRWVPYLDFLKYGFSALQENHWSNVNEPVVNVTQLTELASDKVSNLIGSLPDRFNISFLQGSNAPEAMAPAPADDMNWFENQWEGLKDKAGDAVMNVTQDVSKSVVEKVLGISIDSTVDKFNETITNTITNVLNSFRKANDTVHIKLDSLSDLEWGTVVLSVLDAGPPHNPWVNWVVQSLFFFFFVVCAWLAMTFVQHQRR